MCTGVWPVCMSVSHVLIGAHGCQDVLEPLELQLQSVVSHHMDAGTEHRSSRRAARALNS